VALVTLTVRLAVLMMLWLTGSSRAPVVVAVPPYTVEKPDAA
jgi:hypothetical protein